MKKLMTLMLATISLVACNSSKTAENAAPKSLILYYSQTGVTQQVAEELQRQLGADIETIELENPYDIDFNQTIERCKQEMELGQLPALKPLKANLDDYDQIFLGYPIWFGTYALPIASLIQNTSFEGKKVIPFCTFGSGGLQKSTQDLKEALPMAEVMEGYGIRTARIKKVATELNRFLIEWGYKEGEIEALPAFMEHHPVSEEEASIFNEACADYQYPLGTPIDVAARETDTEIAYEFTAENTNANGEATQATILVVKSKEADAKAEFTQVIR